MTGGMLGRLVVVGQGHVGPSPARSTARDRLFDRAKYAFDTRHRLTGQQVAYL